MSDEAIRERATTYTKAVMDGLTKAGLTSAEAVGEAALRCMIVADAEVEQLKRDAVTEAEAYRRLFAETEALRAQVEAVRALADSWTPTPGVNHGDTFGYAAYRILSALSSSEPVTAGPEDRKSTPPSPEELRLARENGPRRVVPAGEVTPPAEQRDATDNPLDAIIRERGWNSGCGHGAHSWVQGEGVEGVGYLKVCTECDGTYITTRNEWLALPARPTTEGGQ